MEKKNIFLGVFILICIIFICSTIIIVTLINKNYINIKEISNNDSKDILYQDKISVSNIQNLKFGDQGLEAANDLFIKNIFIEDIKLEQPKTLNSVNESGSILSKHKNTVSCIVKNNNLKYCIVSLKVIYYDKDNYAIYEEISNSTKILSHGKKKFIFYNNKNPDEIDHCKIEFEQVKVNK